MKAAFAVCRPVDVSRFSERDRSQSFMALRNRLASANMSTLVKM
jgi:hypothetical protein